MRVTRIEPERLLEQLRHWRQKTLTGKVEIVRQPPLSDQEANELLRGRDVAAVPEGYRRKDVARDRKGLTMRAKWPLDCGGVVVVILGTVALERVDDRERPVWCHDDGLREERLIVAAVAPAHRIRWGAALTVDRGVTVHRPDQPLPDVRVVDDELAVAGHIVRVVRSHELSELARRICGVHRHHETDPPHVVAARGHARRRLHPVAPERPERVPFARDISEAEARALQETLPNVDVIAHATDR
jgi:hypothetical protein